MTSEGGTVLAVDVARRGLAATMDDGRFQRFDPEELDAAHLAHAYAVTVHRSQGATVDRAHVYEDGGRPPSTTCPPRVGHCQGTFVW